MEDDNQNWITTKKFFSETLLIALLTGVGYMSAFAYQYSYLQYFNVPVFFVDINLGLILLTTSLAITWLLVLGMSLNFLIGWKPQSKSFRIIRAASLAVTLLIGIFFPVVAMSYDHENIWSILPFLFLLVACVVIVVISLYKNPEFLDKTDTKRNKNDFIYKAEQIYGSFPVLFVAMLILFIAYSGLMGTTVARNTSNYLVSNTIPNLVIISTYQDSFLAVTFSSSTHTFNKEILLLTKDKISQDKTIFYLENTGRLTSK